MRRGEPEDLPGHSAGVHSMVFETGGLSAIGVGILIFATKNWLW